VKQEATITQLKKDMDALVACLKEHDSKIQRVTDQIEMSSSASQMVVNDKSAEQLTRGNLAVAAGVSPA